MNGALEKLPKLRDMPTPELRARMFSAIRSADKSDYSDSGRAAKWEFAESCWRELVKRGAADLENGVGPYE